MTELIQHLQAKAGISAEQAEKALLAVKEYVTSKFPMLEGAVENMFASAKSASSTIVTPVTPVVAGSNNDVLDKISDVIPGQTGEKIEEFAKNAAGKAEEAFDAVKDKLSGLFGSQDEKK